MPSYVARNQETSPLDTPWHLGLITKPEYNIPPEAVPDILAVQEWSAKEHPEIPGFFESKPIPIRQALWIARLRGITNLLQVGKTKGMNENLDIVAWLWAWSNTYAEHERICNLSGTDPDTTELDKPMWHGDFPVAGYTKEGEHHPSIFIFTTDDRILTVKPKREGEK